MSTTTTGTTTTTTTDRQRADKWAPGYLYLGYVHQMHQSLKKKLGSTRDWPLIAQETRRVTLEFTQNVYENHFQALNFLRIQGNTLALGSWYGLGKELWPAVNREDGAGLLSAHYLAGADEEMHLRILNLQMQLAAHPQVFAHVDANGEIRVIAHNEEKEEFGPFPTNEEEQNFFEGYVDAVLAYYMYHGEHRKEDDDPLCLNEYGYGWEHMDTHTLAVFRNSCWKFLCRNLDTIRGAKVSGLRWSSQTGAPVLITDEQKFRMAGREFWLTQQGGKGFDCKWRIRTDKVGLDQLLLYEDLIKAAQEFEPVRLKVEEDAIFLVSGGAAKPIVRPVIDIKFHEV